jgi:hypothetical protein
MKIKLLKFEQADMMRENSITKICFFEGHGDNIYNDVKERVIKLLESNPWLASKIIKEKKEVMMEFDETLTPDELIDNILIKDMDLCIDESMEYNQMRKAIEKHVVSTGNKLLKTGDYVFKVTLLSHKINNTSGVAVVFSISHVPVDGYTYYKLLNAFFDPSQITAMNYNRNFEAVDKIEDFIGKVNTKFTSSAPMIINVLKNLLFGKKVQYFSRFVDEEKVGTIKDAYSNDEKSEFPFISTNDVITSSHCKATNSRLTMSAINLRNRIKGMGNNDAGNYEFVLLLDREHSNTPEAIRRTLSSKGRFEPNDGILPGVKEAFSCNITLVTNASSFIEDYKLGDLKQILHLPIFNPKSIFCDFAVVYKAKDNRSTIFYFGKSTSTKKYLENSELGETVSETLFK